MNKVRITVMKTACYQDLIDKYENPNEHACDMKLGQIFIAVSFLPETIEEGVDRVSE